MSLGGTNDGVLVVWCDCVSFELDVQLSMALSATGLVAGAATAGDGSRVEKVASDDNWPPVVEIGDAPVSAANALGAMSSSSYLQLRPRRCCTQYVQGIPPTHRFFAVLQGMQALAARRRCESGRLLEPAIFLRGEHTGYYQKRQAWFNVLIENASRHFG